MAAQPSSSTAIHLLPNQQLAICYCNYLEEAAAILLMDCLQHDIKLCHIRINRLTLRRTPERGVSTSRSLWPSSHSIVSNSRQAFPVTQGEFQKATGGLTACA